MTMETKHPLRIDKHTIIYVTADKCNEDYAAAYRKRMVERDKAWNTNRKKQAS